MYASVIVLALLATLALARPKDALPGCDDEWSFAVLSDVHIGDANAQKVRSDNLYTTGSSKQTSLSGDFFGNWCRCSNQQDRLPTEY